MKTLVHIAIELDHNKSLKIYREAGFDFPVIPEGMNTFHQHFKTTDGDNAVIVNQTGFSRILADNEEPVNGCLVIVALDAPDDVTARAALEHFLDDMLSE